MSYLLEALGRGLIRDLRSAFDNQLPNVEGDDLDTLRARVADSPSSRDLLMRLGVVLLREMHLRDARAAFEQAHAQDPDSPQPLLGLAGVSDTLGNLEETLRHLQAAAERDPNDAAIAFALAFSHERLNRPEEARRTYRQAIEQCPYLHNAHERLAALAIRDGNWAEAIEQYECLSALEPGNLDSLLTLGNLYLQADRPADAIEQYQQALFIEPETDGMPDAAERLATEGRITEAIQTLEKLVRKYPGVAPFHVHLGDMYVKAGHDERAIREYQNALATQPNFLEATVKLGTQHMRKGRLVDAALTFNHAVELNDRLITAFVGLGVAQHACGHEQESLATFDLAASLEPSTTLLFSETARLQVQSETPPSGFDGVLSESEGGTALGHDDFLEEAIQRHELALAGTPGHADLHYRHGLLLRQVGRLDEATEALRRAIEINPQYSKALVKLAICLKERGEVDGAIETFQRALRLEGQYVDVHYQLGLLFAQRSQFDLAAEQFEQAVAGNEQNVAFRANLALALQNIGMVDRAAATWRSICELSRRDDEILAVREQILRQSWNS